MGKLRVDDDGELMGDDLRPTTGTVEVTCQTPDCGWTWWLSPLDPSLPDGPFLCSFCQGVEHICSCKNSDGGRPIVPTGEPCRNCGRVDAKWDGKEDASA